ncbi:hypothetical protein [Methyloceanibacter sp. wino2]|uniref:hypothetical protein n=1 Tax=Methyloceanibacter sp. wino2 TaxID=2170729 RepID=UPI00131EFCCA|nr:hypothetical protein [Methyloceanibacter sp. wino2]
MPSFAAITTTRPLSDTDIIKYRDATLRAALYHPSTVRTFIHQSRRSVVFELCGLESAAVSEGPHRSFATLSLFEGRAVDGTEGEFLTTQAVIRRNPDPARIQGAFYWLRVNRAGDVLVDYDPLLAIPLYYATATGLSVISDRSSICAAIVGDEAPDPLTGTWVSSLGYAVGERTMFERVRRASVNSKLLSRHGEIVDVPSGGSPFHRKGFSSGKKKLLAYREAVASLLQAHVKEHGAIRLGLTGGKDSRLVLSFLLDAGLHHQSEFFVHDFAADRGGGADAVVAQQIARMFGLNLEVIPRPSAVSEPPSVDALINRLEAHAFSVDGLTSGWDAIRVSPPSRSRDVDVKGLYGEVLKHFYKRRAPELSGYSIETTIPTLDPFGAFLEHTKETLSADLLPVLARHAPRRSNSRDFADVFYCTQRLPNWAGVNYGAKRHSSLAFSPLYNRALLALPFRVSYKERQAQRFHHDIISLVSPELADIAFANDKWAPHLRRSPPPVTDPPGIPKHGGWQYTLAKCPEITSYVTEVIASSSAAWTAMIDRARVIQTIRDGSLTPRQISSMLGLVTTSLFEMGELTAPKTSFVGHFCPD